MCFPNCSVALDLHSRLFSLNPRNTSLAFQDLGLYGLVSMFETIHAVMVRNQLLSFSATDQLTVEAV